MKSKKSINYKSEHIITTKHYLVLCVSAFTSGIFFIIQLNLLASLLISVIFLFIISVISAVFYIHKRRERKHVKIKKFILLPIILFVSFIAGIFCPYHLEYSKDKKLNEFVGESIWLYGTVSTTPNPTSSGYSYSFEMNVYGITKEGVDISLSDKIIMYIPPDRGKALSISDDISCWTDITYPKTSDTQDAFDYHTYLKGKNIFVVGNTKSFNMHNNSNPEFPKPLTSTLMDLMMVYGDKIRNKIMVATDAMFCYDTEINTIIKGILIGDKSGFTDKLYDRFSIAGISHIVAVSGMHLSILFAALSLTFSSIRLHRKITLVLTLPCIILFIVSAGFSPSVCRSAIMLFLTMLATLMSRRYNSMTALFFALGIILSVTPYALFSPGLVLSFSATLGILVYYKYFNTFMHRIKFFSIYLRPIVSSISLSLSSFIGTAFFTILFFERVSWIQALTNLWVIPLVTIAFCGGYLACIMYYFLPPTLLCLFIYPVAGALEIINATSRIFGKDFYAINISFNELPPFFSISYWGIAFIIYLLCKNASDNLKNRPMRH